MGQRNIHSEHLFAHLFSEYHQGLSDLFVTIIDKTNVNDPTAREGFWTYNTNSLIPRGLNQRDFF